MQSFRWVIKNRLATAPIPRSIQNIRVWKDKGVKAVVILVEDHELAILGGKNRYFKLLENEGLEFFHSPIRDFYIPTIEQCMSIMNWIDKKIIENKPVLIHCYGGLGRTGTIAACYLIYRYGFDPMSAIEKIRSIRPRSIESPTQINFVYMFYEEISRAG
ncbi:MAG: hypothetical protein DRJ39_03005 [Thermoprotei archaeon]|nr:dual specificity protein phosphatase family protein [Thermoproteales archaeon]RLE84517.1 MAG: hypothetical protein DRJ39_03005 [Thermoprotei archaeon]